MIDDQLSIGPGSRQCQALPIVGEPAGKGAHHHDPGRHLVPRPEDRGVSADQQQKTPRGYQGSRRKDEIVFIGRVPGPVEPPSCAPLGIVERLFSLSPIEELDEFHRLRAFGVRGRVVMDLVHDDRAHTRTRVPGSQGRGLERCKISAGRMDPGPAAPSSLGGAIAHADDPFGRLNRRAEIDVTAGSGKRDGRPQGGLGNHQVAACRDQGICRQLETGKRSRAGQLITELPAADVDLARGGIVQFDPSTRRVDDLVNPHGWNTGSSIRAPGASVNLGAGTPGERPVRVTLQVREHK